MPHILYEGPSELDGSRDIVALLTGTDRPSANQKTGPMLQTFILDKEKKPSQVIRDNEDGHICGDCIHRKERSCYVDVVRQGPDAIWQSYHNGKGVVHQPHALWAIGTGRKIRLGAYGDPAAVPKRIWDGLTSKSAGWTGYTHQWETADLQEYCMASVETQDERSDAKDKGFRTYRVTADTILDFNERWCPSAGGVQCISCMGCGGTNSPNTIDFTIPVHGAKWKQNRFVNSLTPKTQLPPPKQPPKNVPQPSAT